MPTLGRRVEHDPRSLEFPARRSTFPLQSVKHTRHSAILDQGDVGSCTGNAMAGLLGTEPYWVRYRRVNESVALKLYSYATTVDPWPGSYPPADTGSSGLAVAKAAKHYGYITGYSHAFGIDHALAALQLGPVITGTSWYSSMFYPDSRGIVTISGDVAGGHEYEVIGYNHNTGRVKCANSWGTGWARGGFFYLSVADWARLLDEQGDVITVTA